MATSAARGRIGRQAFAIASAKGERDGSGKSNLGAHVYNDSRTAWIDCFGLRFSKCGDERLLYVVVAGRWGYNSVDLCCLDIVVSE